MLIVEYNTEIPKTQKKRTSTQRYSNFSLLKRLRRFLIGGLCGLLLNAIYLDNLLFATT